MSDLEPDTEYKLILNVNGHNITETQKGAFSQGSVFKTLPIDSTKIDKDPLGIFHFFHFFIITKELLITGNLPSDGKFPDKHYTQTIDAMLTGGNAVKDGGEMACMYLWSEFFNFMQTLRKKSHEERLIPFALGVADGELGFNIDSDFAANGDAVRKKNIVYRSNQIFGKETALTLGKNFQKIPLYRYFVPLLTSNKADVKKNPFRTTLNPANTFSGYNLSENFFAIMDSGYGSEGTGSQLKWLEAELK